MKTSRLGIHIVSVLLLVLWGGVMLYFYSSGRITKYLQADGFFQPMVLVGGVGLLILALFNLITMGAEEADCCAHDHGHDHDHKNDHDCGHDHHNKDAAHEHSHEHDGCCGHDHKHEEKHDHATCGHDHSHDHAHQEKHDHGHAGHAHGILDESGPLGRLVAILILSVPVSYAAIKTPDSFSAKFYENKGGYSNVVDAAGAAQHSLKKKAPDAMAPPVSASSAPVVLSEPPSSPSAPGTVPVIDPKKEIENQATKSGNATKSYGSFSLADLKAQVPQSKEGNFLLEVPEIYYTAGDKEVQSVLNGQPVETIAQVLPEKVNNEKGTRLRIFRLLIQCCAADARPFSVPVEFGKEPPKFKDMSWVKVIGKMTYHQDGTQTVPVLEATSMVESAAPDNSMVY